MRRRSQERKQHWLRQTREKSLWATRGSGRSIYGGKGLNFLDVSLIRFYSYVNVRFGTWGPKGEVPSKGKGRCLSSGEGFRCPRVYHESERLLLGLFGLRVFRERGFWSVRVCPLEWRRRGAKRSQKKKPGSGRPVNKSLRATHGSGRSIYGGKVWIS